ncbi:MAG: hypothetical protein J6W43_05520 [Prevotella sp.]|nr:hypothetical protein [Prevotella sp.]
MKKIILTVVAAMTMTLGFAETKNNQAEQVQSVETSFDLSFDVRRLADKLQLTSEQIEAVQAISNSLNRELETAAQTKGFGQMIQTEKAISKDMRHMRRILNDKQYNTYVMLMGTTIRNQRMK